jgi:hypothetical protein
MNRSESTCASSILGVALGHGTEYRYAEILELLQVWFHHVDCRDWVEASPREDGEDGWQIRLKPSLFGRWTPGWDTVGLAERLAVDFADIEDRLELEIVVSMLASPIPFEFPSLEEWESTVRVRANIVRAASKTFLSFDAYGAERPDGYWDYDEARGFVVRPGKSILDAFRLATQPGGDGPVYSFSCYRATEYVIALGLAEEIQRCNGELFNKFQLQCERRAIRSGEFHEVFMKEYGSHQEPLPPTYYVPGDRVWFKNPDPDSADALGFEGSWVFYLGNGRFTDFWKRNQAFTLELKCLEMYHWRHSTYRDSEGILRMDEKKVQACMRASERSASELDTIYRKMARVQDRRGVYADGGCIDPSREYPRWVRPGTTDIVLPDAI